MPSFLPGSTLLLPLPTGVFPATILALQQRWALVEVRPPENAPTFLLVLDLFALLSYPDAPRAQELPYQHVPYSWLRAIVEAGSSWIGRPKKLLHGGLPLPSPEVVLQQREFCLAFAHFLHEGSGQSTLSSLMQYHCWIAGWTRGACLVLAEALCFWITETRPASLSTEMIQARLRVLALSPCSPYHVVASITRGERERLIDAQGIWTREALLTWHTRAEVPLLLDEHAELFKDMLRDPEVSYELAHCLRTELGAFPLQLFLPEERAIPDTLIDANAAKKLVRESNLVVRLSPIG